MSAKAKTGSGRTKGATSFSGVTLEELNRVLQPGAIVPVARRFVEMLSMQGKPITGDTQTLVALSNKVEFKIEGADEEEKEPVKVKTNRVPAPHEEQIRINVLDSI